MFVGRDREKALLSSIAREEGPQFVAVYGRRRVGKTMLIRESFGYSFTFQHAGLARGSLSDQLYAFADSLRDAGLEGFEEPRSWLEAFSLLKGLIRASRDERKVIFIDELSWMDTPRSNMLVALESFWNGWASARRDVVLVVCASATSWMLDNVIHNKGGLYNRLTAQIHLEPFTLAECEHLCMARGVALSRHQLLEGYMVLGASRTTGTSCSAARACRRASTPCSSRGMPLSLGSMTTCLRLSSGTPGRTSPLSRDSPGEGAE